MQLRRAIVVRVYRPYRQSVVILTAAGEKLLAWYRSPRITRLLVPGALIAYEAEEAQGRVELRNVELLLLPRIDVREDLLFLHHVLEIIDAFMAEGSNCSAAFATIMKLYASDVEVQEDKKLFVGRLLACMGVYPPLSLDLLPLYRMITKPELESTLRETNSELVQEQLRTWLLGCLSTHPRAHTFVTIDFIRTS